MISILKEFMGVENNTFWIVFGGIIGACIPILWNVFQERKTKINESKWKLKKKERGGNFYLKILIYAVVVGTIIQEIYIILCQYNKTIGTFLGLICSAGSLYFINKRKSVRERLLQGNKKIRRLLINIPIVVMMVMWIVLIYGGAVLAIICMVSLIICEIIGLDIFRGYAEYENSFVDIRLNTSEEIQGVEIDRICKSGQWLIITNDKEKRCILFKSIISIRYYGEPKYVLEKAVGSCIKKSKKS